MSIGVLLSLSFFVTASYIKPNVPILLFRRFSDVVI